MSRRSRGIGRLYFGATLILRLAQSKKHSKRRFHRQACQLDADVEEYFMRKERLPDYLERLEKQSRREKDESKRVKKLQEVSKEYILANAFKEYGRLRGCIYARITESEVRPSHLPSYKEEVNDDYSVSQGDIIAIVTYRQTVPSIRPITLTVTFARTKAILGPPPPETNKFMPVVLSLQGPIQWATDENTDWARDEEYYLDVSELRTDQ
jgi:hypothetical protein